jgi:Ca-activated chloride channel family protein
MAETALSMLGRTFATPWALVLVALVPVLGVVGFFARRRRRRTLARLGRLSALAMLTEGGRQWTALRYFCFTTALSFLAVGIAGPRWGREPRAAVAPGRDLIVVLDLSASMLADDVPPSRLGRAREALTALANQVQKRGGHRLALVAFAARAKVVCPLTHDYAHFRDKLADLDAAALPRDLRPGPGGSPSGTRIGAGLQEAVSRAFDPRYPSQTDILLVSDGDDPALDDGEYQEGIAAAREAGLPVWTVGIGDPAQGAAVPGPDGQPLREGGEIVITRLQKKPLEEIARRTGGAYLAAQTEPPRLDDFFRERIEPRPVREAAEDLLPVYRQRYPWFFAIGLVFLALEMLIGRRQQRPAAPTQLPLAA